MQRVSISFGKGLRSACQEFTLGSAKIISEEMLLNQGNSMSLNANYSLPMTACATKETKWRHAMESLLNALAKS